MILTRAAGTAKPLCGSPRGVPEGSHVPSPSQVRAGFKPAAQIVAELVKQGISLRMIESPQHRRQLLQLAREVAKHALRVTKDVPTRPKIEGLCGGAFVTFWGGTTLRGCVGTFGPTTDIAATIEEMTHASLRDPRFVANPIQAGELSDLNIEISILTEPVRTDDPLSLIPGKHGIIIRREGRSGCFLPKVATERGWLAEEFLSNCCTMKARLAADAWRVPDAEVLLFEAESFSDSDVERTL
jgi:AmmeMemoRadiSam system protein A